MSALLAFLPHPLLPLSRARRPRTRACLGVSAASSPAGADAASARAARLSAYLSHARVKLPDLLLGGGGAAAARDIAAGVPLVHVPRAAALAAAGDACAQWWVPLTARLLEERGKGAESAWAEYLEALPERPGGVGWACVEDGVAIVAERLRRYGLAGAVRGYWGELLGEFGRMKDEGLVGKEVELRVFVWAVGIVQSRGFRVDCAGEIMAAAGRGTSGTATRDKGVFALLPGLDFLNHSVVCKTKFRLDADADCYEITSGFGWERGEEVFISYGAKPNTDLLFFYGFVEGNSPADAVCVESSEILRRVFAANKNKLSSFSAKSQLLRERGIVGDAVVYHARRDTLDDEVLAILRVAFASDAELAALDSDTEPRNPLSLANELLVWRAVELDCGRRLARLPKVSTQAEVAATALRKETICSAVWDWHRVGDGSTIGEAVLVAEWRDILEATRARMRHFIDVSEKLGRVTTVLLPPTQSLLSTTVWEGLSSGDGTSGISAFTID